MSIGVFGVNASAQVTYFEAPGNLLATQNPGCVSVDTIGNDVAPPDLALAILACVNEGDYNAAVPLSILLGLRARFDTLRVTDKTSHQAGSVLNLQIQSAMAPGQLAQFRSAFEKFGGTDSAAHTEFCKTVNASGTPNYIPTYMIQHGMGAIIGTSEDGLVSDFDAIANWTATLSDYLKCSI